MRPDETTLSRLAAASQVGDRQACTVLLKECARWFSRYYASRIAPAQLDDLVQETLLSVHRKLESYDPDQPFLPWVTAIARYRWIEALRKSYRRQETTINGQDLAEAPEQEVGFAGRSWAAWRPCGGFRHGGDIAAWYRHCNVGEKSGNAGQISAVSLSSDLVCRLEKS